jgi:hypothetical protein
MPEGVTDSFPVVEGVKVPGAGNVPCGVGVVSSSSDGFWEVRVELLGQAKPAAFASRLCSMRKATKQHECEVKGKGYRKCNANDTKTTDTRPQINFHG